MVTKSGGNAFEDTINAMRLPGVSGEKPEVTEANRQMSRPITDQDETVTAAAISGGPQGVAGTAKPKKKRVICPSCNHAWMEDM